MSLVLCLASIVVPVVGSTEIGFPAPDETAALQFHAATAARLPDLSGELWHLRGQVRLQQGDLQAECGEALLWITGDPKSRFRVRLFAVGNVRLRDPHNGAQASLGEQAWLGPYTTSRVEPHSGQLVAPSAASDELRRRAGASQPRRTQPVEPAAYQAPPTPGTPMTASSAPPAPSDVPLRLAQSIQRTEFQPTAQAAPGLPPGTRRVRIFRRSNVPLEAQWLPPAPDGEQTAVIHAGVNLVIDGLAGTPGFDPLATLSGSGPTTVDILADRIVVWTRGLQADFGGQAVQADEVPLEVYFEGNIVFRQGDLVVYADRMYYDVRNQVGTVLRAEVLTPMPGRKGLARLKADVLQQVGQGRFQAQRAYVTTSRMGRPGYRLQSSEIYFQDVQQYIDDPFTGAPRIDLETGAPAVAHEQLVTSNNNVVYLGRAPVFYWPTFATDLSDPTFYIQSVQVRNDRIFGNQILTTWDAYQLLGIRRPPPGTKWSLSGDYLSERGFGFGTSFKYQGADLFTLPGPYYGFFDGWAINDRGLDRLGNTRENLVPEADFQSTQHFRYRVLGRHRQELPNDLRLTAELGVVSDRNFLEQFYEHEWDEFKDQATGVELKRQRDNYSWSITADGRLNDFITETQFLPRFDHFQLGEPLIGDRLTWNQHSNVAYAQLLTASTPLNAADAANFGLRPWEVESQGLRAATRHSLELPLDAGPFKVVPYVLGELAYWGEDLTGNSLDRAYGQAGLRLSLPLWGVNPALESTLYNVHGVAHKAVFDVDLSYADATRDLSQLPLYDKLDDDNIESFRRRIAFLNFGGITPARFDERFYALRSGLGGWVTSPSTEVADDLAAVRFGLRQRWQTKRGLPGKRRIIDWIVLDTNAVWFPNDSRDNFNEPFGLVDYDFRWHVGDRLTLVSAGVYDFFLNGQQTTTVGGFLSRPPRGNLYLGYRRLEGPFSSQVVQAAYSYRMSPKWLSAFGTSFDLGDQGNIGQQFTLTRIGESFLVSVAVNVDSGKDNVGISFAIEPRFLSGFSFGTTGPAGSVPIAGAERLE